MGIPFERQELGNEVVTDGWNILARVPGVYVLAGVNAPMLLAMVPMLESAVDTEELIQQGIQAAREGCVFINDLMKQVSEESEEDFA